MRLRERYLQQGPADLGDVDLLALAVGLGTARQGTASIALDLLGTFRGPAGLVEAPPAALLQVSGLGQARAVQLHAALELGRRSARRATESSEPVLSARDAYRWLGPGLAGQASEELHCLYLDRRNRVLHQRVLTRGSDAFTVVDPRQIFRPAVALGSSAVILAHNHPSGDPSPSVQDVEVTERVCRAGEVLGISLLDHLVIAGSTFTSLAERGHCLRRPGAPNWTA